MAQSDSNRGETGNTTRVWRAALLATVAGLFALGQAGIASAQGTSGKSNRSAAVNSKRDVPIRHPFGENMPKGPLQLMVSIGDQRAVLYSNGIRVAETKVSTGTASHPTPTGVFSIIQKNRWHRSNIYGNAPMFYMHRLTWSGIALHEGHLPGFAASHGCIRMPTDFVSRLWNVSKLGMRVVVARVELTPQEFSHAKLFNPASKPADNVSGTSDLPEGLRPSLETVGQGMVQFAEMSPATGETSRLSDAPSVAAGIEAHIAAGRTAVTVGAEMSAAAPEVPATTVTQAPPAMVPPAAPAGEPATTATVVAPSPIVAPPEAPVQTVPAATERAAVSEEPQRPAIDPDELRLPRPAPLRARAAEPVRLNGQVAVFISGKEKRIFVRHAFVPLFDMPVEIANPSKPLGTHTFTALEVVDNGSRMRWNVVSMPLTAAQPALAANKKGAPPPRASKNVRGAVVTADSSNATDALDRVTIPPEVAERIAELLTPGSSLIISDEGLGRETGRYTEFIVETR